VGFTPKGTTFHNRGISSTLTTQAVIDERNCRGDVNLLAEQLVVYLKENYPKTLAMLSTLVQCPRCLDAFTPMDTVGRLGCWRHLLPDGSCCRYTPGLGNERGCMPCDHASRFFPIVYDENGLEPMAYSVPEYLVRILRCLPQCIIQREPFVAGFSSFYPLQIDYETPTAQKGEKLFTVRSALGSLLPAPPKASGEYVDPFRDYMDPLAAEE